MPQPSLWDRFRSSLGRTRERLGQAIGSALGTHGKVDPETRQRLEEGLLAADVGPTTAERLTERAEERMKRESGLDLGEALERVAAEILGGRSAPFEPTGARPWIALLVGVNGVGKTTLAGKLAGRFAREGRSTLL